MKNHGGKREGSGRPYGAIAKTKKHPITIQLEPWLKQWLKENPRTQNGLIEEALINYYKLKKRVV